MIKLLIAKEFGAESDQRPPNCERSKMVDLDCRIVVAVSLFRALIRDSKLTRGQPNPI